MQQQNPHNSRILNTYTHTHTHAHMYIFQFQTEFSKITQPTRETPVFSRNFFSTTHTHTHTAQIVYRRRAAPATPLLRPRRHTPLLDYFTLHYKAGGGIILNVLSRIFASSRLPQSVIVSACVCVVCVGVIPFPSRFAASRVWVCVCVHAESRRSEKSQSSILTHTVSELLAVFNI